MSDQKPLHIVTLQGSLRKASYHAALARALPALAPDGMTIKALGSVSDFPLYTADTQGEGFPAPVVAMGEAIAAADGVVIITPGQLLRSGTLKNALDWLSRLPTQPFAAKPTAIQSGSPGLVGGARAQYHLRQILVFLDAYVMNKPEVMVSQIMTKVDVDSSTITDDATRTFIATQLKTFAAFARRVG